MSQRSLTPAAKGELVFTSFLFLAGIVVLTDTTILTVPDTGGYVSPKIFPYAIGLLLTSLSIFQIIQVLRGKLGEPEGIEAGELGQKGDWKALSIAVGSLIFYVVFLQLIGFVASATVLFSGVAYSLGAKKLWRIVLIALLLSFAIFVGFTQGLQLQLPVGFDFLTPATTPTDVEW